MSEERPPYQKNQARIIGLVVLAVVLVDLGYAVAYRDWELLKGTLIFAGALLIALGILAGSTWLVVRGLKRRQPPHSQKEERQG